MSNPNPCPEARFTKGDPRINRKGRPKDFDALRSLAQEIAHEKAKTKDGTPLVFEGHAATVAEMILRQWAKSGDWQRQKGFLEIAFGKVPDEVKSDMSAIMRIEYVNNWRNDTPAPAPGATDSPTEPGPLSLVDGRPSLAQDDNGGGDCP